MYRIISLSLLILGTIVFYPHAQGTEYVSDKIISQWDFTKASEKEEIVPNSIEGMPSFKFNHVDYPVKVYGGLRFDNGASVSCSFDPGEIPGFLDGETPFELRITFTPLRSPSGSSGALFDCGPRGIRVSLWQILWPALSFKPVSGKPVGVLSKNPLPLEKQNVLIIQFMPKKIKMLANGKLVKKQKGSLPRKVKKLINIRVGAGYGKDMYFNGIIKDITIRKLVEK